MITYIIQSSAAFALLFLVYKIALENSKLFAFNRFYLLFGMVLSFLAPLMQWSIIPQTVVQDIPYIGNYIVEPAILGNETQHVAINSGYSLAEIVVIFYATICIALLVRVGYNLYNILTSGRPANIRISGLHVYTISEKTKPHSFFNRLYVQESDVDFVLNTKAIVRHEQAHAMQLHSLDLIIIEIARSLFWFHPIWRAYKSAVTINHEFLADAYAEGQEDVSFYAQHMLRSASNRMTARPLVSGFSYIQLKKRINMLQTTQNTKAKWSKAIIGTFIAAMIIAVSAFKIAPSALSTVHEDQTDHKPAMMPIKKGDLEKISSHYGKRVNPLNQSQKMHTGIDLVASEGTPILSTAEGNVILIEETENPYGKHIVIAHGETYQTHYAHLSQIDVEMGDAVSKGQQIGIIGNTGQSLGVHLHYEVIKDGEKVDPAEYFN